MEKIPTWSPRPYNPKMDRSHWSWLRIVPFMIALMSGILSLIREYLLFQYPMRVQERTLFWASVRVAFVLSAAIAWWIEHNARRKAETRLENERPKIIFGLLTDIDWSSLDSYGEFVFTVTNIGKRIATYVKLQPLKSVAGVYTIHFEETDVLPADAHHRPIVHEIENGTKKVPLSKRALWEFLHNCPAEQQSETFEVVINFKDNGKDRQQIALMRFDLNIKKLSVDPH